MLLRVHDLRKGTLDALEKCLTLLACHWKVLTHRIVFEALGL